MRIFFFSSHSILGKKSFSILFHNRIDLPVYVKILFNTSNIYLIIKEKI